MHYLLIFLGCPVPDKQMFKCSSLLPPASQQFNFTALVPLNIAVFIPLFEAYIEVGSVK